MSYKTNNVAVGSQSVTSISGTARPPYQKNNKIICSPVFKTQAQEELKAFLILKGFDLDILSYSIRSLEIETTEQRIHLQFSEIEGGGIGYILSELKKCNINFKILFLKSGGEESFSYDIENAVLRTCTLDVQSAVHTMYNTYWTYDNMILVNSF